MEYVELKTQIEASEQQIQALKAALQAKKQEAMDAFCDDIKAKAAELDYDLFHIASRLQPQIPGKPAKRGKIAAVYVNPDNRDQTYTKGPKPAWLKARMTEFGIDPADKQALAMLKDLERAPIQVSEAA